MINRSQTSCFGKTALRPAAAVTLCLCISGAAQALTTFTAGTPAKAAEVNDNVTELSDRIGGVEARLTGQTTNINCSTDSSALANAVPGSVFDLENSAINATRAPGGTCPADWDEGIRLHNGSILAVGDNSSTLSGYLEIGMLSALSALSAWSITNFGGTLNVRSHTLSHLPTTTGLNTCTP